jgi:glycosyltransferase involved in cell wall biosynthesis
LIILDTVFPHPLSPFRFTEFSYYLNYYPKSIVLTTGEHLPALKETRNIKAIIKYFTEEFPKFKNRVVFSSHEIEHYEASLAYMTFLNNTVNFLDSLEKKKIPFIFTLYPGGGFEIDNPTSDGLLVRVFDSPFFRKVIVTQKITYEYLLQKNFCGSDQIEFVYGVVTSLPFSNNNKNKINYGFEKDTLDICFVAHKYMEKGIDKGYDIFIETAKKLSRKHKNVRFHVIGSFTKNDIPINEIEDKITFYGLKPIEWFDEFYLDKDIILSPNIPFTLLKGSFDGFPTASCTDAGFRKVAIFCTDNLKLNIKFMDREDIVIIPHNSDGIVEILDYYYSHPAELRKIAENGSVKIRDVYSYENQILPRIKIINEILGEKTNEIRDR